MPTHTSTGPATSLTARRDRCGSHRPSGVDGLVAGLASGRIPSQASAPAVEAAPQPLQPLSVWGEQLRARAERSTDADAPADPSPGAARPGTRAAARAIATAQAAPDVEAPVSRRALRDGAPVSTGEMPVVPDVPRRGRRAAAVAVDAPGSSAAARPAAPDAAALIAAARSVPPAPSRGRRRAATSVLPVAAAAAAVAPAVLDAPVAAPVAPPAAAAPAPMTRRARRLAEGGAPAAAAPVVPAAGASPAAPAAPVTAPAGPAPVEQPTAVNLLEAGSATAEIAALEASLALTAAETATRSWDAASTGPILLPAAAREAAADAAAEAGTAAAAEAPGHDGASAFVPARARRAHRKTNRTGRPTAGLAGVLGLATIVAPVATDLLPSYAADGDTVATGATTAVPAPEPTSGFAVLPAVDTDSALAAPSAQATPTAAQMVAQRAEALAAANREKERIRLEMEAAAKAEAERKAAEERAAAERAAVEAMLPGGCSGVAQTSGSNGRLDTGSLCNLWEDGQMLRADAAVAFAKLNAAYRTQFGTDISITDSYRTYASQVSLRRSKPGLAARPGTSEHGWGMAVDLGGGVEDADAHYDWLRDNAPAFGWDNPGWARSGGSGAYEPWHWEFVAGQ